MSKGWLTLEGFTCGGIRIQCVFRHTFTYAQNANYSMRDSSDSLKEITEDYNARTGVYEVRVPIQALNAETSNYKSFSTFAYKQLILQMVDEQTIRICTAGKMHEYVETNLKRILENYGTMIGGGIVEWSSGLKQFNSLRNPPYVIRDGMPVFEEAKPGVLWSDEDVAEVKQLVTFVTQNMNRNMVLRLKVVTLLTNYFLIKLDSEDVKSLFREAKASAESLCMTDDLRMMHKLAELDPCDRADDHANEVESVFIGEAEEGEEEYQKEEEGWEFTAQKGGLYAKPPRPASGALTTPSASSSSSSTTTRGAKSKAVPKPKVAVKKELKEWNPEDL